MKVKTLMKKLFGLLAFFISCPFLTQALAAPLEAHVHGTATLQVAVDADTLIMNFSSPLDNLLGFERKPHNQAEVEQVQNMIKQFYKSNLFLPTKDAQCKLQSVHLNALVIKKKGQAARTTQHSHEHEAGHADLDAEIVYQCNQVNHLRDLQVNAFKAFPHLHHLAVEIVSNRGQTASTITSTTPYVSW